MPQHRIGRSTALVSQTCDHFFNIYHKLLEPLALYGVLQYLHREAKNE